MSGIGMNHSLGDYADNDISINGLTVEKIPHKQGAAFINRYHYTGGCSNSAMIWGCYYNGELVGAIAFATPISENVRKSIFGNDSCECDHIDVDHTLKEHVTELHRLALKPECPKNTASWLISKGLDSLKDYKPKYWAVVSFADTTEGHTGTIYQATNAYYYGMSDPVTFYRDETRRLRSPRQCGENVTPEEARRRGWEIVERDSKHRYLYLLTDPYQREEELRELVEVEFQPYP